MAKTQKQELAVIDFTQFSVAQLPELKGKKEEIASVIEANPIVEIVDNATYESAKKSRTAVRTLRTSLESEQKTVKKRIKENVLDVVDKEYDTLVLGVKSAEQSRQSPIDAWETKKEQEKQEKAFAEQQRIDGIKTKISDYVASWKEAFSFMVFGSIKEVYDNFHESNNTFNKTALQEFDVLFDREISTLTELLDSKISTLKEQEQIRVDNLLIQEKNTENGRIQAWQSDWNGNIDTLSFGDIADVKTALAKSKLANLKHYVSGYEEIFTSTEKRLNSQIEFVSKAEEQRIAQEKLDQEKKDFEEKQAEVKIQNRIKQLTDLGLVYDSENLGYKIPEEDGNLFFDWQIMGFDDNNFTASFDWYKEKIDRLKNPIEAIEVVSEEVVEMPLLEETTFSEIIPQISEVGRAEYVKDEKISAQAVDETQEIEFEETWDSIREDFRSKWTDYDSLFEYLKQEYNVPTKKQ